MRDVRVGVICRSASRLEAIVASVAAPDIHVTWRRSADTPATALPAEPADCDVLVCDASTILAHPDLADSVAAARRALGLSIVIVSANGLADAQKIPEAIAVDAFVSADLPGADLASVIRLVNQGYKVFHGGLATDDSLLPALRIGKGEADLQRLHGLSGREIAVLKAVAVGLTNKEIAIKLGISDNTVRVHMRSAMKKIGVTNRTQASVWAGMQRLMDMDLQ
jgi:DNA-binding NarL/FixJ family response regulator